MTLGGFTAAWAVSMTIILHFRSLGSVSAWPWPSGQALCSSTGGDSFRVGGVEFSKAGCIHQDDIRDFAQLTSLQRTTSPEHGNDLNGSSLLSALRWCGGTCDTFCSGCELALVQQNEVVPDDPLAWTCRCGLPGAVASKDLLLMGRTEGGSSASSHACSAVSKNKSEQVRLSMVLCLPHRIGDNGPDPSHSSLCRQSPRQGFSNQVPVGCVAEDKIVGPKTVSIKGNFGQFSFQEWCLNACSTFCPECPVALVSHDHQEGCWCGLSSEALVLPCRGPILTFANRTDPILDVYCRQLAGTVPGAPTPKDTVSLLGDIRDAVSRIIGLQVALVVVLVLLVGLVAAILVWTHTVLSHLNSWYPPGISTSWFYRTLPSVRGSNHAIQNSNNVEPQITRSQSLWTATSGQPPPEFRFANHVVRENMAFEPGLEVDARRTCGAAASTAGPACEGETNADSRHQPADDSSSSEDPVDLRDKPS